MSIGLPTNNGIDRGIGEHVAKIRARACLSGIEPAVSTPPHEMAPWWNANVPT